MILIEAGERSDRSFEAKVLFCAQLARHGHDAAIDDATLPEAFDRNSAYEAAPFLRNLPGEPIERLIVIGPEVMTDAVLSRLKSLALPADAPVHLVARFADHQARISAQSRLAYAIGREPEVIDLAALQPAPLFHAAIAPAAATADAIPMPHRTDERVRVLIFLPEDALENPMTLPTLMSMDNLPDIRLSLVLTGRAKERVRSSKFAALEVFGLVEQSPASLAGHGDIAVIFGDAVPGERVAAMATDMLAAGKIVVDCTATGTMMAAPAPAIRGPLDLGALANYLCHTVLINRSEIARQVSESPWTTARRIETLERLLGLPAPARVGGDGGERRTVFLPTNGAGLGHARRCTLIAGEMPAGAKLGFAAFPSCVPLVREAGYDCLPLVQKSPYHPAEHANDLVNYMRLRRTLRPGDRLVFDGGYVFDSIYRTIVEKDLEAAWLRRGLWQPGQINAAALDRESVFRRVIVPLEAFDELNADMSHGDHIRKVGPIVGARPDSDRAALRARLAERLDRPFDELVVSMLGGGVAADRTAHLQMLSALMERRSRSLHLILIWPGATVAPALYGWKNTRVCQSRNAADFAAAADLVISAAGYNSFHEAMYHGLPAIFIPQMAAYMDDQERRAEAAAARALAVTVAAGDLLMLEREVVACLDGGKAEALRKALADAALPERGNRSAAALIAEDWR